MLHQYFNLLKNKTKPSLFAFKWITLWLSLPILHFHVLEGLYFRRFSTRIKIQSAFIYINEMLPYAVQVKICTAQELQLRFLMRWRAVLCSSDWSVMFVFKHCIFLLLDFIVLRYGHGTSVFSDETAWVCHSALSSLLCVGVSEGNVYLINVRVCVYYSCLLVRMHLGDLRGF